METTITIPSRWDALDVLRGLTIILMLMNLTPGSWEFNYPFLVHASWKGWTLIDMVAPAFLFCIGAAMPLSLERRSGKGDTRATLLRHVLTRGLLLIAIGLFLNLYPRFDFATFRIPGVLQRIGLCYMLTGAFVVLTARQVGARLAVSAKPLAIAAVALLVSYWLLLYFVPVPGFGPARFDAVGSWPSVIDRAVIGVAHFFPYWPVDGKVVFDPEGILSTWPSCFNVLLGALAGLTWSRGITARPAATFIVAGSVMMALAMLFAPFCPLVKNIWTSTFALFSGGFALVALGALMPVTQAPVVRPALWPARIFGENPLLAYILVFLAAPLIDAQWLGAADAPTTVRNAGQAWFSTLLEPRAASLLFALCGIALIFVILLVCHRKRWILKL
ncbi:MAG TPA: heparan-alpha-glucosaminide N-acetyltransferase domain-containing protein [Steroidobacteraceae bacterium]|nr:heparan-alpha-glucosaminide N-acetyltransferase domain-containing protein [Steroidobacteraceae bacterium]